MGLSKEAKKKINALIKVVVENHISGAPNRSKANSGNPFVIALLKDFEPLVHRIHGLKTSLGNVMEKIAQIIALDAWGEGNVQRKTREIVNIPVNVFREIDSIINNLSNARTLSDYEKEKKIILSACKNPSKETEQHTFEFDLIVTDTEEKHTYIFEMKSPDPNTTEVSGAKKRLLVAIAWAFFKTKSEKIDAHFAIYYNNKYPKVYKNPKVHYYFNPKGGTLVQEEFWNFLGKNKETFNSLIELFESYGKMNKKKIWDAFSKLIKKN